MTVKTQTGRKELNNAETIVAKRRVSFRWLWCNEDHKYIENGKTKYRPYVRGGK